MRFRLATALCAAALAVLSYPAAVRAQTAPAAAIPTVKLLPVEQPIRNALGLLFQQAKVPYVIGSGIDGNITVNTGEMPFEKALAIVAQAASPELYWWKNEQGVYIVRVKAQMPPPAPVVNVYNTMPKMPISLMAFSPSGEDPILTAIEMQMLGLEVERKSLEVDYNPKGGVFFPAFERINKQREALLQARQVRMKILEQRKSKSAPMKPKTATPSRSAKK